MADLEKLKNSILTGKKDDTAEVVSKGIEEGTDAQTLLGAMLDGMAIVGARFKNNEMFVPEVLIAARAMNTGTALLEPLLKQEGTKDKTTVVIGTVKGDLHDIGKNLVALMWKGANFEVIDLGTDVVPEKFITAAKEHSAHVIGLSALLTTTMPAIKTTVDAIRNSDVKDIKVVIGGAPVTETFGEEIGADGFAADAASAVDIVKTLVKK